MALEQFERVDDELNSGYYQMETIIGNDQRKKERKSTSI